MLILSAIGILFIFLFVSFIRCFDYLFVYVDTSYRFFHPSDPLDEKRLSIFSVAIQMYQCQDGFPCFLCLVNLKCLILRI